MNAILSFCIAALFSAWVWMLKRRAAALQAMHAPVAFAPVHAARPHAVHVIHHGAGVLAPQHGPNPSGAADASPTPVSPNRTRAGGVSTWTIEEEVPDKQH